MDSWWWQCSSSTTKIYANRNANINQGFHQRWSSHLTRTARELESPHGRGHAHAIEPALESRGAGQAGWTATALAFGAYASALDICFTGCVWGWKLGFMTYILMTVCKRDGESSWAEPKLWILFRLQVHLRVKMKNETHVHTCFYSDQVWMNP
jgi:hypothetical protein